MKVSSNSQFIRTEELKQMKCDSRNDEKVRGTKFLMAEAEDHRSQAGASRS